MPTEYWLQKKSFNSWSHVTWYDSLEEAQKNFNKVAVEGNGYSWRMVEVKVVEEKLNEGGRPVMKQDDDSQWTADDLKNWQGDKAHIIKNSGWTATPAASGWGKPAVKAAPVTEPLKSEHGLVGSVWVGNPSTKEKKRVPAEVANAMMKEGWIKAGPRTVL